MSDSPALDNRIALMISDVDGTLLDNNKELTSGAPEAVQRLYQAGIRFTIASARPPRMVQELVEKLKVREPLACFNGALFISPEETVLQEIQMSPRDAQQVADFIAQRGFDLWVWTDSDWFVSNPSGPHVARHEAQMGSKATPLATRDMSQFRVLKLVGVSDNYDAVAQAEADLAKHGSPTISGTRSSSYYLDVTDARANKGEVVLRISEMLRIPTEQIATIGDMTTDTFMFRKSGVSIAMGNAFDEVKAQAKFVTKSNEENGFAYAMDHFVLGVAAQRVAAN
jgi:Cof subfamily protein (haloacid dehalogenase superfamily)